MRLIVMLSIVIAVSLTGCSKKPADPTRSNFILVKPEGQKYYTQCGIDTINGTSPNGVRFMTSETYGIKDIEVACIYQPDAYFAAKSIYRFVLKMDAKQGGIYDFITQESGTGLVGWFQERSGARVTDIVNGTPSKS